MDYYAFSSGLFSSTREKMMYRGESLDLLYHLRVQAPLFWAYVLTQQQDHCAIALTLWVSSVLLLLVSPVG